MQATDNGSHNTQTQPQRQHPFHSGHAGSGCRAGGVKNMCSVYVRVCLKGVSKKKRSRRRTSSKLNASSSVSRKIFRSPVSVFLPETCISICQCMGTTIGPHKHTHVTHINHTLIAHYTRFPSSCLGKHNAHRTTKHRDFNTVSGYFRTKIT